MTKNKWIELLKNSNIRLEDSSTSNTTAIRSEFQRDFDRIIFSSAFRRLQNKTQVLPLPKSDYVRNRLTHSIETSSVGRSLGNIVGRDILKKYPAIKDNVDITHSDFGYMVSSACLAHDIGNPPFGHSGEKAIGSYFKKKRAQTFLKTLNEKQIADLINFEGNSAGFRIISKTLELQSKIPGGLNLTYGTYATFTKYPKEVLPDRKDENKASLSKYGLFQSEIDTYKKIANKLNLKSQSKNKEDFAWHRFPLSFLVEAADDICYHIIDFEDGYNVKLISFEEIYECFTKILILCNNITFEERLNNIIDKHSQITYLRSLVINELIYKTSELFIKHEKDIIEGSFDKPLLKCLEPKLKMVLDQIMESSIKKIYKSEPILKIETAGLKVIPFLLHTFIKARLTEKDYEGKKQILGLLPVQYHSGNNKYENILNIAMFISSMTDRFAVELYKNLNGIELAGY